MSYKKIHLITDEFILRKSVEVFEAFKSHFSKKEINYTNFGHYPKPPDDQSLRIRVEFSSTDIEKKALDIVQQFIGNGYVIDIKPLQWKEKYPSSTEKTAITLSSECASILAKLDEFKDIKESNQLSGQFCICFINQLFDNLGISLGFNQDDIKKIMKENNINSIVDCSVKALDSTCKPLKSNFTNWRFFERFTHMLNNNLLIFPWVETPAFRIPFYQINKRNSESYEDTLKRFCSELKV